MKDFKEEMLNQQEYLEIQKEGAIIILDYYNERLKNIADNGIEPTGHLMRIEIQERKIEDYTKQLAEITKDILNFWI